MSELGMSAGGGRREWVRIQVARWVTAVLAAVALAAVVAGIACSDSTAGDTGSSDRGEKQQETRTEDSQPRQRPADTETPESTGTAGGMTADESAYAIEVFLQMTRMAELLESFQTESASMDFSSPLWRARVLAVVDDIQEVARDMQSVQAPSPKWEAFNEKWNLIGEKYADAMALLKSGINNTNASAISDATALIVEANALLDEATSLMPSYN